MLKKSWFYVVFFGLLILLFYVGLQVIIPGYAEVRLPVINYVRPLSFTSQDGRTITQKDVAGKVYVAEYFFTTCRGICPKLNTNMKGLFSAYRNEPDFMILSHTVDPETDSVGRMKRYADSLGADPRKWLFLTGRKDSLYSTARNSYLLDDPKNNATDMSQQFIHTQFFALVDRSGRVRKIADGLKKDDIEDLKKGIDQLLKEQASGPRFANSLFGNNPN